MNKITFRVVKKQRPFRTVSNSIIPDTGGATTVDSRPSVGVVVMKGKRMLLGRRKNMHGAGSWHFPGGHLGYNESIEQCARSKNIWVQRASPLGHLNHWSETTTVLLAETILLLLMRKSFSSGRPSVECCEITLTQTRNGLENSLKRTGTPCQS